MIKMTSQNKITPQSNVKSSIHMPKQQGFTLIELVVVVVILGFLAANAIPKFIDLTDQAKQANIEGMAGGFATGVSLARSQWEAEGRPKNTDTDINMVNYDGTVVYLTSEFSSTSSPISAGYIVGTSADFGINAGLDKMDADVCISVWNSLLQQPPSITANVNDINDDDRYRYLASVSGSKASTLCYYHLKETLERDNNGEYKKPSSLTDIGNSFSYQPANSSIIMNINNS